ncbi:unnamed protein product, partial [Rotaria socialis]
MFYQKGENKNGGVLVLVRLYIQATRIECKLHNVCVLDIKGEEILRIIGVYAPNIKPHPYTDSPFIDYDNVDEPIPEVKLDELELTVQTKRKKKSLDAHGISNFMFNFLDQGHWSLFLKLFNHSFQTAIMPKAWKDTRMVLLAKNEPICSPSLTRPISLIDSFLK